jgi:hypothetical protein
MKRLVLCVALALIALPALTQNPLPADEHIERVSHDLRTLARIAGVAENINGAQQILLAILDEDIRTLRMPREDGTYQWASLQRVEGDKVKDEKTIERVHSEDELREVTLTAEHPYRVVVTVPGKRGLFSGNNRVFIRNVIVDATAFDGSTIHQEVPVNVWVNPGDAHGVPLPDIAKSAKVVTELGVESGGKQARAEVALIQAKLVDDPLSPYYPAVTRLVRIRDFADDRDINRGHLKQTIDEALLSLPGELEKRVAEQEAAAQQRREMAAAGTLIGSIALGDATPDVLAELDTITRLLGGTLEEQAEARRRLEALTAVLKPPVTE